MKEKETILTFIQDLGLDDKKQMTSLYKCDCGKWKIALRYMVKSGKIKSCGCLVKKNHFKKHNLKKHPLYGVWSAMKTRCYNKNSRSYSQYGGLGITVCDEWLNSFESFYNWAISNGWEQGKQIDKDIIPKMMGVRPSIYSPETCKVVSREENINNKWNLRLVEYNGETMNCTDLCKKYNVDYKFFIERLNRGWSVKDAIEEEPQRNKRYVYNGVEMGLYEMAKKYDFSVTGLYKRIKKFNGNIKMAIEMPKQSGSSLSKRMNKVLNNKLEISA